MRLKVEYFDQNESFATYLPRSGETKRSFVSDEGTPGWFLFELDEPFDYQLKVGKAFRFREVAVTHFLLRSRWDGHDLGGPEPTSVFILLVENGALPLKEPLHVQDYVHIAWGMCAREPGGV
jgi:hypothetical protein